MTRMPAAASAMLGLALLGAGCGAAPAPHGSAAGGEAVAFSRCMRANGVANFPDPGSTGTPKETLQQLGVSSARFQAANSACRHLLPNGGRPPNQSARQEIQAQGLRFARCVRAHGVPSFPDPGSDGRIPDPASVGINQGSPKFESANQACATDRPPYMPSNSAYNAWARTHGR